MSVTVQSEDAVFIHRVLSTFEEERKRNRLAIQYTEFFPENDRNYLSGYTYALDVFEDALTSSDEYGSRIESGLTDIVALAYTCGSNEDQKAGSTDCHRKLLFGTESSRYAKLHRTIEDRFNDPVIQRVREHYLREVEHRKVVQQAFETLSPADKNFLHGYFFALDIVNNAIEGSVISIARAIELLRTLDRIMPINPLLAEGFLPCVHQLVNYRGLKPAASSG
ncbi:hypothetical protein HY489_03725 [Candidatus Woesearchaeota archaeon]|nr:hypothetical protein [Candidatus Woesearchaeota archaeon]